MNPFVSIEVPTFGAIVGRHAAIRPDAAALRYGGRTWTYGALDRQANRIANGLFAQGLDVGDRIAWLGRNSDAIALLALACARAGMIFVPINWRLGGPEVVQILDDCRARLLVLGDGFARPDGARSMDLLDAAALIEGDWLSRDSGSPDVPVAAADTMLLIYTSGTTGKPKGVMLSHRSLFGTSVMRHSVGVPWDDWSFDDVTLVPVPLAHIGGFGMLARTLFFGGETVIQDQFDPGAVLDAVAHMRISKIGLVPAAMRMVIEHPRAREIDYSRIRTIIYGAAPITSDLLRQAIATFGCQFAQSYGMSETSGTCVALPPEDHASEGNPRMRSAGRPLPGTEVKIVDGTGATLSPGHVGEISIRCISVMNGYWNQPEAAKKILGPDGWFLTGDAGLLDDDGYLFIVDRMKDMIISGAENIYSAEIENVLAEHPDVLEVAVIGVPDDHWGEAVKAIIVAAPGKIVDREGLIQWSKKRIAAFKAPKTIDIVDELPRNATGKIQKALLRAPYWANIGRSVN